MSNRSIQVRFIIIIKLSVSSSQVSIDELTHTVLNGANMFEGDISEVILFNTVLPHVTVTQALQMRPDILDFASSDLVYHFRLEISLCVCACVHACKCICYSFFHTCHAYKHHGLLKFHTIYTDLDLAWSHKASTKQDLLDSVSGTLFI